MSLTNFQFRPAIMDDLYAVLALINTHYQADYNGWRTSRAALLGTWQSETVDLARDTQVVYTPASQLVAYALYQQRGDGKIYPEVYVLPTYRGQGLGSALLKPMEARAQSAAPAGTDITLTARVSSRNLFAMRLHDHMGYVAERSFSVMEITLHSQPEKAQLPPNLQMCPFVLGQDEHTAYLADEEAFRDDRGHTPRPFKMWQDRFAMRTGGFDATLCFLIWDGEEVAGLALNAYNGERGWIEHVGVRRPWRKQGLGMALMLQSFAEFYRRGTRCIGLNVDTQSLTGANRLYERAGMQTIQQYHVYIKRL